MNDTPSPHAVMVATADPFDGSYLVAALARAGLRVLGPFRSAQDVRLSMTSTRPTAVVLADRLDEGPTYDLRDLLTAGQIPQLVLIDSGAAATSEAGTACLRKPYAAFQVVDWAIAAIAAQQAEGANSRN
jgi:hypothetical protein